MRSRRIAAIAVAAGAAMTVAACGGSSGNNAGSVSAGQTASGDGGSVTVWTIAGPDNDITQAYLEKFGAQHSIKITFKPLPGSKLHDQLPLALRTGQGPDVFSPNNLTALESAGYLHPLDDVLSAQTKAAYKTAYQAPSQYMYHGQLLALPTNAQTIKLLYNKDLFSKAGLNPNKPPTTFSEVLADSAAITQKVKGAYGFGLPLKFNGVVNWMIEPMIINGSTDLTQHGLYNVGTHKFDFSKFEPEITLMRGLLSKGYTYPGATSLDIDPLRAAFAQGKVGMYVDQSAAADIIDHQLKSTVTWGVAPTPVPDGQQLKQEIVHIGGAWAINKNTKNLAGATKVLESLLSKDLATQLAEAGLDFPASTEVDASKLTVKGSPHFADCAYKRGGTERPAPNFPSDDVDVQGDTWRTGVTKLLSNDKPIKPALDALAAKYDKALNDAVAAKKINLSNYGYPPAQ